MIGNLLKRNNNKEYGLDSFRKNVDKLFDDFFFLTPTSLFKNDWEPTVDVEEDDKSIHVKAEIPGIDEKDLDVRVENNVLTLSGEKREERKEEKKNYIFSERKFGSFSRSISLPDGIKTDRIKATFKKGVLNIDIPKDEVKESKKIAIDVH
ncbi:MAG: Hsp20/alpha crystallin family protein [Spirochaetes bacterium]|nr:Hsp20/alpha crystallin family protein [Spirochaetota bacterium]